MNKKVDVYSWGCKIARIVCIIFFSASHSGRVTGFFLLWLLKLKMRALLKSLSGVVSKKNVERRLFFSLMRRRRRRRPKSPLLFLNVSSIDRTRPWNNLTAAEALLVPRLSIVSSSHVLYVWLSRQTLFIRFSTSRRHRHHHPLELLPGSVLVS